MEDWLDRNLPDVEPWETGRPVPPPLLPGYGAWFMAMRERMQRVHEERPEGD